MPNRILSPLSTYAKLFPAEMAEFARYADYPFAQGAMCRRQSELALEAIRRHDFGTDSGALPQTIANFQAKYYSLEPAEAYGYCLFTARTYGRQS